MNVKIKALDTFTDSRIGLLHAKQETVVSEHCAQDLEKAGLVKIIGSVKDDLQAPAPIGALTSHRRVAGPTDNKMLVDSTEKRKALKLENDASGKQSDGATPAAPVVNTQSPNILTKAQRKESAKKAGK